MERIGDHHVAVEVHIWRQVSTETLDHRWSNRQIRHKVSMERKAASSRTGLPIHDVHMKPPRTVMASWQRREDLATLVE